MSKYQYGKAVYELSFGDDPRKCWFNNLITLDLHYSTDQGNVFKQTLNDSQSRGGKKV